MALTDNPAQRRILDNIVTTLNLIDASGGAYYHTVREVEVSSRGNFSANEFPHITVSPLGTEDSDAGPNFSETTRWNISLWGSIETPDRAVDGIHEFVHDIHKALMSDRFRGTIATQDGKNNAINTIWSGWTPFYPADDADVQSWVECRIQVLYRTADTDMTITR